MHPGDCFTKNANSKLFIIVVNELNEHRSRCYSDIKDCPQRMKVVKENADEYSEDNPDVQGAIIYEYQESQRNLKIILK